MAGLTGQNDLTFGKAFQYTNPGMVLNAIESIDSVIQITSDVNVVLDQLMDAVLRIFNSSRAWLFHPCNPKWPFFDVSFESSTPEYSGAKALKQQVPMTDDMADYCRRALSATDGPEIDPPAGAPINNDIAIRFNVKSMLFMALRPKSGNPWMFGLHQCDRERVWSNDEKQLFHMIGKRISGCLDNLIYVRQLRESEQRFRSYVENANDIIYSLTPDGCFNYVSPNWIDFFGETADEAIGKSFEKYVHPEDVGNCRKFLEKVIDTGEKQSNIEFRVKQRDGFFHWHVSSGSPLRNPQGEIINYLGVSRDVNERKQAERALRESEEKFSKAFRSAPLLLTITTIDRGIFIEVNDAFVSITGYSREAVIGSRSTEIGFVQLEDRNRMLAILKAEGCVKNLELNVKRSNGSEMICLYSAEIINIKGQKHLLSTAVDISDRKRAEERLKESEKRFRLLVESSPISILMLHDGKFTYANPASASMLGFETPEGIIGIPALQTIAPEHHAYLTERMERIKEGEFNDSIELKILKSSGEIALVRSTSVSVKINGLPTTIIFGQDVTEAKASEKALQEREEHFRKLFDTDLVAMVITRRSDGKFLQANPGFYKITGYSHDELIGRTSLELNFLTKQQRNKLMQKVDTQGSIRDQEIVFTDKTGNSHTILYSVGPITTNGENCLFATMIDITERKLMGKMLKTTQDRLEYLVANSSAVIYTCEPGEDYGATFITDNIFDQLGYEPLEFTANNKFWVSHIHPGDSAEVLARLPALFEKGHHVHEYRFLHKDGDYRWMQDELKLIRDTGGRPVEIIGSWTDITKRKMYEEAMKKSYQSLKLRGIISSMFLSSTRNDLFHNLLQLLLDEFESRYGYFGYIDEHENLVCPSMTSGVWDMCRMPDKSIVFPKDSWGGVWGESLQTRRSILRNRHLNLPEGHLYLHNAMAVPLIAADDLVGQIVLANKPTGYWSDDLKEMEDLCNFIAPVLRIYLEKERVNTELQSHTKKLEEKNIALKVLLENRAEEKKEIGDAILKNFERLVFPYYEKLKTGQDKDELLTLLNIIEFNTKESLSPIERNAHNPYRRFTPMEIQVADLIKAGKSSKEIARVLHISVRSVFFHRDNIRKKLGIKKKQGQPAIHTSFQYIMAHYIFCQVSPVIILIKIRNSILVFLCYYQTWSMFGDLC